MPKETFKPFTTTLYGGKTDDGRLSPPITVKVTKSLIREARAKGWNGTRMFAEAVKRSVPGSFNVEVNNGAKIGRAGQN